MGLMLASQEVAWLGSLTVQPTEPRTATRLALWKVPPLVWPLATSLGWPMVQPMGSQKVTLWVLPKAKLLVILMDWPMVKAMEPRMATLSKSLTAM